VTASSYLGVGGTLKGATATVTGNVYVSNALTTTNVYLMSSTLASTPRIGEIVYDGSFLYSTINSTNGRGVLPVKYTYRLGTDTSSYSTGNYFFSGNSTTNGTGIPLIKNSTYEIDILCFCYKDGNSGTVTFTLDVGSSVLIASGYAIWGTASGTSAAMTSITRSIGSGGVLNFPATTSINNNSSFVATFKVMVVTTGSDSTLGLLVSAISAGTMYSKAGSYISATKIVTSGTFV